MKRTVVVLLTLGALAYFMACTSRVGLPPKNFGSKIYFIPMGDFPRDQMQRLADYYKSEIRPRNSDPKVHSRFRQRRG